MKFIKIVLSGESEIGGCLKVDGPIPAAKPGPETVFDWQAAPLITLFGELEAADIFHPRPLAPLNGDEVA